MNQSFSNLIHVYFMCIRTWFLHWFAFCKFALPSPRFHSSSPLSYAVIMKNRLSIRRLLNRIQSSHQTKFPPPSQLNYATLPHRFLAKIPPKIRICKHKHTHTRTHIHRIHTSTYWKVGKYNRANDFRKQNHFDTLH